MAAAIKAGFLESATGAWLALLAKNVYGVDKILATFATGQVQVSNAGGGVYPFNPGELQVKNSSTGAVYANTASITLNPTDVLLVDIQALIAGSASTSAAGTIDALVTELVDVTCMNPAAVVGTDDETDEVLRQRCRDKLGSLSPLGPRAAYAYAVRSALRLDGSPVDINRLAVSPDSSTGVVDVYCASPSGTPISTDLDAVAANIEAVARPDTVTVNVHGATTVPLASSLTVWAYTTAGLDAPGLTTLVENALIAMIEAYPIGGVAKPPSTQGYLYQSTIEGTALGAHDSVFAVDGVGGDLAISPGQVATLTATVTVRFVPAPPP